LARASPTTAIPHRFSPSPSAVDAHLLYFYTQSDIHDHKFPVFMVRGGAASKQNGSETRRENFGLNKIYCYSRTKKEFSAI
jgi:hypothetical protein